MYSDFLKKERMIAGFTLIETLVAILIFSMAMAGLLLVVSYGIQSSVDNQHFLRAQFLALEGIEIARNARDNYFLSVSGNSWDSELGGCPISNDRDRACEITFSSGLLAECNPADDCRVRYDSATRLYGTYGQDTVFRRKIFLEKLSDDEVLLSVDVSWPHRDGSERVFTLQENLRLWR